MSDFTDFRRLMMKVWKESGQCEESRVEIDRCTCIPELVQLWKRYWGNMADEVPQPFVRMLARHYEEYAVEINKAGVYFNEIAPRGFCIIGDMPHTFVEPLVAHSSLLPTHVYILGRAHVVLSGISQGYMDCAEGLLELRGMASATVRNGHTIATGQSRLVTASTYERRDGAKVYVSKK